MLSKNPDKYKFQDYDEDISPGKKVAYFFWDLVKVVCIALAIIIPVRYFLIQPFYVKGASMEPSFYDDEYLIIDELSYRISQPERGDIIVFRYPKDPSQFFIKRVIALPGEKVEVRDGFVFVYTDEGEKKYLLDEMDYLDNSTRTLGDKVWNLEADEYYVLGDNREHSLDSRVFGPVGRGNIVGKVWLRGWPLTRVKIFSPISYEQFSENK